MRLTEKARSPAYTTACASSFTGLARNVSMQSINYTSASPRLQDSPGMCLRSQLITRLRLFVHRAGQECVYAVNKLPVHVHYRYRYVTERKGHSMNCCHQCCVSGIRILLSSSKNSKKNLDFFCFVTFFGLFVFEKWCKCSFKKVKSKKT